jgi:hypothetical protein
VKITETIHTNDPSAKIGRGPALYAEAGVLRGEPGATYTTLGRTDDTVYAADTVMLGDTTSTGKTWRRPRLQTLDVFSWRRGGRMRLYRKSRIERRNPEADGSRYHFHDSTNFFLLTSNVNNDRLEKLLLEHTGAKDVRALIRKEYPLIADLPPAPGITPYLALPSVQEFTRGFYGPSRYRKDLVRGVGSRGWITAGGARYLLFTKAIAPMIPVDWIARDLVDMPEPTFSDFIATGDQARDYRETRRLLRLASPKQVRALWKDRATVTQGSSWIEGDTYRSLEEIHRYAPDYRLDALVFDGWKSLHDVLAADQRRIKTVNQEINHDPKWLALAGEYEEYRIEVPKDTHTLIEWGGQMANCIGGYTTSAVSNRAFLYAVYKGDKMICNMEMTPKGELRQMVGKHNTTLPQAEYDDILTIVQALYGPQESRFVGKRRDDMAADDDGLADWERELLYPAPRMVGF